MKLRLLATKSLYAHTAVTFFVTLLIAQIATLSVTGYLVFLPVFRSSVEDLAALMVLSAQTYVELPPGTRPDFVYELQVRHQINISELAAPESGEQSLLPYVSKLEDALSQYLAYDVSIEASPNPPGDYWVNIYLADQWLRLSFPRERIGTHPPLTLFLLLASNMLIAIVATILVTRRLTAPLSAMADATQQVSHGALPAPLDENGPRELATLARRFNRMAVRVRDLLDTRTTLLAGISHDLRTPMARIRLQVELLRNHPDENRLLDIEQDLEEMDALIALLLDIAREEKTEQIEQIPLQRLISEVIDNFNRSGTIVHAAIESDCTHPINALAFKRILYNFLENALTHGLPPFEVKLKCNDLMINVVVIDHGKNLSNSGIDNHFEPFTHNKLSPGAGLGLAIVRSIGNTYGWRVSLSASPDGSTMASLIIPR